MAVEEKVTNESTQPVAVAGTDAADAETLHQEIALRAYHRYCERGCAPGCDVDDWLEAEREVLTAHAAPTAPVAPASADDRPGRRRNRSRR